MSTSTKQIVLAKGFFDILLSLSIIFFPAAIYDGPAAALISKLTGLQFLYRDGDPGAAYALASLIMGCAFAGITAGRSRDDDAYKTVATLNGVFAFTGLLGCILSPQKFGSAVLFLASLQDVFWFFAIVRSGGYSIVDTLGLGGNRSDKTRSHDEYRNMVAGLKEGEEDVTNSLKLGLSQ